MEDIFCSSSCIGFFFTVIGLAVHSSSVRVGQTRVSLSPLAGATYAALAVGDSDAGS